MKRALAMEEGGPVTGEDKKMKKVKVEDEEEEEREEGFMLLDENLLYEVLKHADAKTLATAACVSRQWHKTAQDERLWELICTRHWANNFGCGNQQLRSVVLALGGFRRLYSLYPVSKPSSSSSSSSSATPSAWPTTPLSAKPFTPMMAAAAAAKPTTRWGKDEVHLSLSLLSIRYYEKMNFTRR